MFYNEKEFCKHVQKILDVEKRVDYSGEFYFIKFIDVNNSECWVGVTPTECVNILFTLLKEGKHVRSNK